MKPEELSSEEKALFNKLKRETTPPQTLEKAVIQALKAEGLIKEKVFKPTLPMYAASVLLIAVGFGLGIFYQKITMDTNVEINPMHGYVFLLHEDDRFAPGEPMAMFREYSQWMENTKASGVKITGQELKTDAFLVDKQSVKEASSAERTTGYFIVEAPSMEAAIDIAKANPHVKYGGTIEVKGFMNR